MSDERERGKLVNPITVKLDDSTLAALDEQQRIVEATTKIPLSRAVFIRMMIVAQLAAVRARA